MRKKHLFTLAFIALLSINTPHTAFAAEIIPTSEQLPAVDNPTITDGQARASWGQGIMHASNPIGDKPRAYAQTKTFAGNAYRLTAQTVLIDADSITTSTSVMVGNNTNSVKSGTILSSTEKAFFIGKHTIQDTKSSGTQSCTTSADYKS